MHNTHRDQLQPEQVVRKVVGSDEFLAQKGTTMERFTEAAATLGKLAVHENNNYPTDLSRQLELTSLLPGWLLAQDALDLNRAAGPDGENRLSSNQYAEAMFYAVRFNQALRNIIDAEQYTRVSELERYIERTLLTMRQSEQRIQSARAILGRVIEGMRHEIAAESAINSIGAMENLGIYDIEAQPATYRQDRMGRDVTVSYTGADGSAGELGIDIKASEASAERANSDNKHEGYFALWSGFRREDFGDKLVLNNEVLDSKSAYYRNAIFKMIENREKSIAV